MLNPDADQPLLYTDLAAWWPLLSAPEDYAEEAATFASILEGAAPRRMEALLELGSGGGNTASHLADRFSITLVDRAPAMLEVSRGLNPGCEHIQADMRELELGREFDRVFVHDAVQYMTREEDLAAVARVAYRHCAPGGAVLLAPDHVHETFAPETSHGGHDGDGRGLRYLAWSHDPDPGDTTVVVDYAYLLREGNAPPRVVHDRHVEGLFPRATWLGVLEQAGFEARIAAFEHSTFEDGPRDVFVGVRR